MKFKFRIRRKVIPAIMMIGASVMLTPTAIQHARDFRGYDAVGGEALIIPMGILAAMVWLQGCADKERVSRERRRNERTNRALKEAERCLYERRERSYETRQAAHTEAETLASQTPTEPTGLVHLQGCTE